MAALDETSGVVAKFHDLKLIQNKADRSGRVVFLSDEKGTFLSVNRNVPLEEKERPFWVKGTSLLGSLDFSSWLSGKPRKYSLSSLWESALYTPVSALLGRKICLVKQGRRWIAVCLISDAFFY